jgi:F-type H+-transporting ATPase subunit epsilon
MTDKVEFEIVTPKRLLLSEAVEMVVVCGGDGDFGVLPGHAPLLSTLRPGTVAIYENDKVVKRLFVAGGFAEVSQDRCTVLAEEALALEDIDQAEAEARLERAKAVEGDEAPDEEELKIAEAMLEAAKAN